MLNLYDFRKYTELLGTQAYRLGAYDKRIKGAYVLKALPTSTIHWRKQYGRQCE